MKPDFGSFGTGAEGSQEVERINIQAIVAYYSFSLILLLHTTIEEAALLKSETL